MPSSESPVLAGLLVGHDTERLDKPDKDGRTHKWKVFVRSPEGYPAFTDRSFIKKVTFQLHETFQNPKRSIRKPPFEVEDTAYGCFELKIQIEFRGVEKIFSINHDLSLSLNKHANVSFNHWIEISKPPSREFIDLAIKYGGKLKTIAQDKPETSTLKLAEPDEINPKKLAPPLIHVSMVRLDSDRESLTSQSTTDKEKHSKKKKKREKEHKKKKEKPDKIKSPKEPSIEMPNLKVQLPIEAPIANLDDLFEEPSPKRERKEEKKKLSKKEKNLIPEIIKRPKFVVSSKGKDDLPTSSNEKVDKIESKSQISPLLNFIDIKPPISPLQSFSTVMNHVVELAKPPTDPISPIGKLKTVKNEDNVNEGNYRNTQVPPQLKLDPIPPQSKSPSRLKNDAYWENFNKIRSLLSCPIKREKYNIGFLHKLDKMDDDFIVRYERPIPLVKFDEDFMQVQFKKEDNRKKFERNANTEERMMLRLMRAKKSESPKESPIQSKNDALMSDLFD